MTNNEALHKMISEISSSQNQFFKPTDFDWLDESKAKVFLNQLVSEGYGKDSSTKSGFEVMFIDKSKVTCDFLDEKFLKLDKKTAEDSMKKWYDSENARLQFENYSITQKRANAALIIAIVSIITSIIIAVLKK